MKRLLCLYIIVVILMTGCTLSNTVKNQSLEELNSLEQPILYKTMLSPNNELTIVRKPGPLDISMIYPDKMTELPKFNPEVGEPFKIDLRSRNLTKLNLKESFEVLIYADFDSKIKWPNKGFNKLPKGYEPKSIMELGKNHGLEIRELHKLGITGKGIGIAIIDQALLVDHVEYKEQLKLYEEIHSIDENAAMHGPAVASIAVGKSVGVAPEADLYYIAETHGVYNEYNQFEWDIKWIAKSIDRIVEINSTLSQENKIRVISISLGIGDSMNGHESVFESIEKAEKDGIYTVYVGSNPFGGLGRDPLENPDDSTVYSKGEFWKNYYYPNNDILVPMDSRSTASPTGINDYVFYRTGGMSWSVPYVAGVYALACQVNPNMTAEIFWKNAFITGDIITVNNEYKLGKILNPKKLIERIEGLK